MLENINVEELLEKFSKSEKTEQELKVSWNGDEIKVTIEYENFEKEKEEIKERLENLKKLVENSKEWDEKIKEALAEEFYEDLKDDGWPESDFEDEDIPDLINDIEKYIGKEEANNFREGNFTKEAFKKLVYLDVLSIYSDGSFTAWLFDIDYRMYGGHYLTVDGNINGEFFGGDMMG